MATVRQLYAMAARLGLVTGEDDAFHQLVHALTGKEHVSSLTDAEREKVRTELDKMHLQSHKPKQREEIPGMMTEGQQRLAWRLVYRLKELDTSENPAPANKRLAGAVVRLTGNSSPPDDPLRWVNREDGSKLIEGLKRYVRSAERRADKKAGETP